MTTHHLVRVVLATLPLVPPVGTWRWTKQLTRHWLAHQQRRCAPDCPFCAEVDRQRRTHGG